MNLNRIRRAFLRVDPVGLIAMGAPFDEYECEAYSLYSSLKPRFTDKQFIEEYFRVMGESFDFQSADLLTAEILLDVIRNDHRDEMKFYRGHTYKANKDRTLFTKSSVLSLSIDELVTCVDRKNNQDTSSTVFFLVKNSVISETYKDYEEDYVRWMFDEV